MFVVAVITAVCLFLLELLSSLYVSQVLRISPDSFASAYANNPSVKLVTWAKRMHPHPYFGYSRDDKDEALAELRAGADGKALAVVILGGSVAEHLGNYLLERPELIERLRPVIGDTEARPLRLYNLALGAYKQPQQFALAAYILEHADLVINVEGFNEAVIADLAPAFPTEFPATTLQHYPPDLFSYGMTLAGKTMQSAYRAIHALPQRLPWLERSRFYFLFWSAAHPLIFSAIGGIENIYRSHLGLTSDGLPEAGLAVSRKHKLAIWRKFARLQYELARIEEVPTYLFVQPNQYLEGSKVLTEEELRTAFNPAIASDFNTGMTALRDEAGRLRADGVPVHDLTGLFETTSASVYKDACCHLNELGNELLAEAVIATILKEAGPARRR